MKVVNIVPVDVAGQAKAKIFAAVDWSLQRWNEEGRESDDNTEEGDGEIEVDLPGIGTYEEEEDEEEDEVDDNDEDVRDRGEQDTEEDAIAIHSPKHDALHKLGESSEEGEDVNDAPHGRSPVEDVQGLGEETSPTVLRT